MLVPQQLGPTEAGEKGVQEGWWAMTESGEPVSGPYPTEEAAIGGYRQAGAGPAHWPTGGRRPAAGVKLLPAGCRGLVDACRVA